MKYFAVFFLAFITHLAVFAVPSHAEIAVEPFTYREDFESGRLGAWASYPPWQDTAYDPNLRTNTIVPGDPNISLEQKVTPYTNVDNYAGAQKLLDMYLTPNSSITLRYYLKTDIPVEFFKVRLAGGEDGKLDATVYNPPTGKWVWLNVNYNDFARENPHIAGNSRVKVNALAVLAKIPNADPAMPIYLGLDDIVFKGARMFEFQFGEPKMHKLTEWKPFIPQQHYKRGDTFSLRGRWPIDADRVTMNVVNFSDRGENLYSGNLRKRADEWTGSIKLGWPEGLYLATLTALKGNAPISETKFTIFIAPENLGGNHPRLWFDSKGKQQFIERLSLDKFRDVSDDIRSSAVRSRNNLPLDSVFFDIDQFPDEDWLFFNRHRPWFDRIGSWRAAVYNNTLAYAFFGDREAGEYAKEVLVKVCSFPYWLHPWFEKRGLKFYYPLGGVGRDFAIGYDLLYDLMDEKERKIVRDGLMRNVIIGAHKGYVEDNLVTNNTSNWVAHIAQGVVTSLAVLYGDEPGMVPLEPYLTGIIFKTHDLIEKSIDSDGIYGEDAGGYYFGTIASWSRTLPELENVFNIDLSKGIVNSYHGVIWSGIIKEKRIFYFGDSGSGISPQRMPGFAWLLDKYQDPLLGWLYHYCTGDKTLSDVFYDLENVPQEEPFDLNPNRLFRGVGRTIFKSGWEPDDFIFIMQTGAFYNHQHLDQGSFWLGDRGRVFIEERTGSTYYNDPLYQPWYTQPIAHSTILIDRNHQSQRVGDFLDFAEGFHDHAYVEHFLDGESAAFVCGDIGRLYWEKVECLRRNVLYLKPRTLLMLDTAVPGDRDVDVTLLYQPRYLKDIKAGQAVSEITRDGATLHIMRLAPEHAEVTAVATPHYNRSLLGQGPMEQEGMLTITARTDRVPIVMANIIKTTLGDDKPDLVYENNGRSVYGTVDGTPFAFTTRPGLFYTAQDIETDALALTWEGNNIFAAMCTHLERNDRILVKSSETITCELTADGLKYYLSHDSQVSVGVSARPSRLTINGKQTNDFVYDNNNEVVVINLPAGEGILNFR